MFRAQDLAVEVQHLLLQAAGASQVALGPERNGEVVHGGEGVRVFHAQGARVEFERLLL